jgi:hypothetical protein
MAAFRRPTAKHRLGLQEVVEITEQLADAGGTVNPARRFPAFGGDCPASTCVSGK